MYDWWETYNICGLSPQVGVPTQCGSPAASGSFCDTYRARDVTLGQDIIHPSPVPLRSDHDTANLFSIDEFLSLQYWAVHQCRLLPGPHQPVEVPWSGWNSLCTCTRKERCQGAMAIFAIYSTDSHPHALLIIVHGMAVHVCTWEVDWRFPGCDSSTSLVYKSSACIPHRYYRWEMNIYICIHILIYIYICQEHIRMGD